MSKQAVGHLTAQLLLKIGPEEPITLGDVHLPLVIDRGGPFATYRLGVDVEEVAEAVRALFTKSAAKEQA